MRFYTRFWKKYNAICKLGIKPTGILIGINEQATIFNENKSDSKVRVNSAKYCGLDVYVKINQANCFKFVVDNNVNKNLSSLKQRS